MDNKFKALAVAGGVVAMLIVLFFVMSGDNDEPAPVIDDNTSYEIPDEPVTPITPEPPANTAPVPPPSEKVTQTGTVQDENGKALKGATVTAFPIADTSGSVDRSRAATVVADDNGAFEISLRPGAYRFDARFPGHQEQRQRRSLAADESPEPLAFSLTTGLSISGYVRDEAGNPIAGAVVAAYKERVEKNASMEDQLKMLIQFTEIKAEFGIEGVSDETGFYQIVGLDAIDYRLSAIASEFAPAELRHIPAGSSEANFELLPGGLLTGTVQSATGAPIAGAGVEVYRNSVNKAIIEVVRENIMPPLVETETDASGRFQFNEIGGGEQYRLVVRADSYQGDQVDRVVVNAGDNVDLTVTLQEGRVISGVVLGPDGVPVEGAAVKANRQGGGAPKHQLEQDDTRITDEQGNFIFNNLEEASYRIVATHDDYGADQRNRVQSGSDIELQLSVGGAVSGHVFDSLTNAPIKGARVTVRDGAAQEKSGVADSNGLYIVRGIAIPRKGEATISVEADGFARVAGDKVAVQEGLVTEGVDFLLDQNGKVSGFVQDSDGNPVAGVRITAKRQFDRNVPVIVSAGEIAVSGPNGEFTVDGVFPGENEYLEGKHRDYLEGASSTFTLQPGEHLTGQLVVMERGGAITGFVVDETGAPIEGARVAVRGQYRLANDLESMNKKTMTDSSGAFQITNLEAGEHTLLAIAADFMRAEVPQVSVVEARTTPNIRLVLTKASFISGYVTNVNGAAIRGAIVECTDTSEGIKKHKTTTDSNGYYSFERLGPYEVDLTANAKGYGPQVLNQQRVNQEQVNIVLSRNGMIMGRVLDDNGQPVRGFQVTPQRLDPGTPVQGKRYPNEPEGYFRFSDLPAGNYKITIAALGFEPKVFKSINVVSDRTIDLGTINLREGAKITGVVLDGISGEPVSGARVTVKEGQSAFMRNPLPGFNRPRRSNQQRHVATTDAQGVFRFDGVDTDRVTLEVQHRNYMLLQEVVEADSVDIQLVLDVGGVIEGTVFQNGVPKANMQMILSGPPGVRDQRTVTDRKGSYTFSGLPTGTYTVAESPFGTNREDGAPRARPETQAQRVNVRQGRTTRADFDLAPASAGGPR